MTKYVIKYDDYDDFGDFPLGVEESEDGFNTREEALEVAIKTLNETKEYAEKLIKQLKETL